MLSLLNPDQAYTEESPYALDIEIQEHGIANIHAQLTIQAPPHLVYHVLTDYEHWPTLFPEGFQIHLSPCSHDCTIVADMLIPHTFVPWDTHLRVKSIESSLHSFELHLLEGDYVQYHLRWKLTSTEIPAQTQAVMDFILQPKTSIMKWTPDFLYEWALRKGLEDHFDKIQQQLAVRLRKSAPTKP